MFDRGGEIGSGAESAGFDLQILDLEFKRAVVDRQGNRRPGFPREGDHRDSVGALEFLDERCEFLLGLFMTPVFRVERGERGVHDDADVLASEIELRVLFPDHRVPGGDRQHQHRAHAEAEFGQPSAAVRPGPEALRRALVERTGGFQVPAKSVDQQPGDDRGDREAPDDEHRIPEDDRVRAPRGRGAQRRAAVGSRESDRALGRGVGDGPEVLSAGRAERADRSQPRPGFLAVLGDRAALSLLGLLLDLALFFDELLDALFHLGVGGLPGLWVPLRIALLAFGVAFLIARLSVLVAFLVSLLIAFLVALLSLLLPLFSLFSLLSLFPFLVLLILLVLLLLHQLHGDFEIPFRFRVGVILPERFPVELNGLSKILAHDRGVAHVVDRLRDFRRILHAGHVLLVAGDRAVHVALAQVRIAHVEEDFRDVGVFLQRFGVAFERFSEAALVVQRVGPAQFLGHLRRRQGFDKPLRLRGGVADRDDLDRVRGERVLREFAGIHRGE